MPPERLEVSFRFSSPPALTSVVPSLWVNVPLTVVMPFVAVPNVPPVTFSSLFSAKMALPALLNSPPAISAPPSRLRFPVCSTVVLAVPFCVKVPLTFVVPPAWVVNSPPEAVRPFSNVVVPARAILPPERLEVSFRFSWPPVLTSVVPPVWVNVPLAVETPVVAVPNVPPVTFSSLFSEKMALPALLNSPATISASPFRLSVPPCSTVVLPFPFCVNCLVTVVTPVEAVLNSPSETVAVSLNSAVPALLKVPPVISVAFESLNVPPLSICVVPVVCVNVL